MLKTGVIDGTRITSLPKKLLSPFTIFPHTVHHISFLFTIMSQWQINETQDCRAHDFNALHRALQVHDSQHTTHQNKPKYETLKGTVMFNVALFPIYHLKIPLPPSPFPWLFLERPRSPSLVNDCNFPATQDHIVVALALDWTGAPFHTDDDKLLVPQ